MARITIDLELMTNYVLAVPVPASCYFQVVLDEERRPMVISISSDQIPKLVLGENYILPFCRSHRGRSMLFSS